MIKCVSAKTVGFSILSNIPLLMPQELFSALQNINAERRKNNRTEQFTSVQ